MLRRWGRAAVSTAAGAVLGVALMTTLYLSRAQVVVEFDRDPSSFTSGFHPAERAGEVTFAWTGPRAVVRLAGVDRRRAWSCTVRLRGARGGAHPQPTVTLSADAAATSSATTDAFADVLLDVPARAGATGLTLTIASAPVFVPGPQDRRELGAQVDRVSCSPAPGVIRPPSGALEAAAVAGASTGAAVALVGLSLTASAVALGALALGHAILLTAGGGAFGAYPELVRVVALIAAAAMVVLVRASELLSRRPLSASARTAVALAAGAGALTLSALSHPTKDLVDAVFQAHRLEWVMAGRYFFTQPLPDGVAFPYAIGLYVTAAPWSVFTRDHVLLLRIVVLVAHAVSALLLYPLVASFWEDRRAGVAAVALSFVVPLTFVVVGNANWPNAFGQSVALVAMAGIVASGAARWRVVGTCAVGVLTALAFLSHVSTLALLMGMAGLALLALFVAGGAPERRSTLGLVAAIAVALGVAVGLYYRHFPEVYERAWSRVRVASPAVAPAAPASVERAALVRSLGWPERVSGAATETAANLGWPLLLLAGVGGSVFVRQRPRDRLSTVLIGWAVAWALFLVGGTLTAVDVAYQRYALEFIGRVNLAGAPVAVLLAARAIGWAWLPGASRVVRVGVSALFFAALANGAQAWYGWFAAVVD